MSQEDADLSDHARTESPARADSQTAARPEESPEVAFEQLLARARAGCSEAAAKLVTDNRDYLFGCIQDRIPANYRPGAGDSDLVQMACLTAYEKLEQFRGQSRREFRSWLRQILISTIREYLRSCRAQRRDSGRPLSLDALKESSDFDIADRSDPIEDMSKLERAIARELALAQLSDEHREIIHLRYSEEKSFKEIGARLGMTPDAARRRHTQAMEEFGDRLRELGVCDR